MHVVAERFIELQIIQHYRPLNEMEQRELDESFQWLRNRMWQLAKLNNLSLAAYITGDIEWHHQICSEIDRLKEK